MNQISQKLSAPASYLQALQAVSLRKSIFLERVEKPLLYGITQKKIPRRPLIPNAVEVIAFLITLISAANPFRFP